MPGKVIERDFMFALHGRPATVDAFKFMLAEKLHRTVGELEATMSHLEYVQWQAYLTAQGAIREARGGL